MADRGNFNKNSFRNNLFFSYVVTSFIPISYRFIGLYRGNYTISYYESNLRFAASPAVSMW